MYLGFCLVSRPVRQALALDTSESLCRPFPIIHAKTGAIIVPELELVQVPLQKRYVPFIERLKLPKKFST
jgi:hypothetical protein